MKTILFLSILILPNTVRGQTGDTAWVKIHVDSLLKLSLKLGQQGEFNRAVEIDSTAASLVLGSLGRESATFGNVCYTYGVTFYFAGDLPQAEKWFHECVYVRSKVLGVTHPSYARLLINLALVCSDLGRYQEAEDSLLQAKTIYQNHFGKNHLSYASALTNLMNLYRRMGRYEEAEQSGLESKFVREKQLPENHPDRAGMLIDLGSLYANMGRYKDAEVNFLIAKKILETTLPETNYPFYANCLNNLAALYRSMGLFKESETLYLQALTVREKIQGKNHPRYASTLNNLAVLYWSMGRLEEAERLAVQSKNIIDKALGKSNNEYVNIQLNLANLYQDLGRYKEAENHFIEVIDLYYQLAGKQNSRFAVGLSALATFYEHMGRYTAADSIFLEAENINKSILGEVHPEYASNLSSHANILFNLGQNNKGAFMMNEAGAIRRHLLAISAQHLSEQELSKYTKGFASNIDFDLSWSQRSDYVKNKMTGHFFNNTLFYKGFLLFAAKQLKQLALSDSSHIKDFLLLQSYQRQLSGQMTLPIGYRDSVAVSLLERNANALEKELARTVSGYGNAISQVSWQEVQATLKPTKAVVEFVHYKLNHSIDSIIYAALVLRPGWPQPRMVQLFEQRQIQPLLAAANTAATAGQLYATRGSKSKQKTRSDKEEGIIIPGQKTASLYQLIWEPIDSLLRGATTVYYAPSGLLHRLQLSAIGMPGSNQTLADKYALVQLGSTRQLVVQNLETNTPIHTAALFGGLQYDLEKPALVPDSVVQTKFSYDVTALRSALGDSAEDIWAYLPGTEKEVKNVATTLDKSGYTVRTFSGQAGSEAAFKMLGKSGNPAPAVLHIATHGFFFPDPKDTTLQRGMFSEREPVFKTSDNPLLRSGLVLAGANPAWAGSKTPEGQEDGILTAYEISQMNLSGTELVVLSACETGLGDVEANEGVYGLKRAFKIAGAKYLIMSLWQVPDKQTQELMSAFYKHWLVGKMPIPKAFAKAQKAMRKRYGDPFFWAAFVLVE
ncbi:MAG: CHAT domain-containing protein [Phycisphaerae bacterium]|nr:CHAT domain-containing protein [Saprospiraceae bacterium]